MKAREVLQLYAAGERDFRRVNLRGQSFKGKDLSGADFSEADIRSANFTNACLKGTKFVGTKAGLSRRWVVFLVVVSWLLAAISGIFLWFLVAWITFLFSESSNLENIVAGWIALITTGLFYVISFRKGLGWGAFAVAGAVAFAMAFAGAFAVVFAVTVAIAYAVAGAVAIVFAITVAIAYAVAGAFSAAFSVAVAFSVAFFEPVAVAFGRAITLVLTILNAYLGWRALRGNPNDAWLRALAIAFAAIGGTSFRGADLTDADFTKATLKSTDLRKANLTRTCWKQTEKLDRIRPGKTYLHNPEIQQLVKTGQGQDKDFNRLNLQGINLQGANLIGTSFIEGNLNEANLRDANLTDTKLVHAQLDRADLTGATLTGAYLEEWNITSETKLNGIRCDYVFMRLPPDKRPAFMALPPEESCNPNPRRKPDDWDKNFEQGEFAEFIEPMRLTLDLYHNQVVDPRLVALAFGQLKDNNPEAEIEAVSIEKKGTNRDKLLVRAETLPQADHSTLNSEYFSNLDYLESLSPEALRALLIDKDRMVRRFTEILEVKHKNPDVTIQNIQIQGDNKMTGDRTIHVGRDYRETNVSDQGTYVEGNYYNNPEQQKTLAQAAQEIQELLEQLDKTYPTGTAAGQMQAAQEAMRQIEGDMALGDRLLSALRAGGTEALKQTLNHPAATFVLALLDDWQKTKDS